MMKKDTLRLQGRRIYLAALEREDCQTLWDSFEYDFEHPTEPLNIGHSSEKAAGWFDEIQQLQGRQNLRLGVFLEDGRVIGDVALQDMDWVNRCCSVGIGLARIADRSQGYGREAVGLILDHGFQALGMERITANTLSCNIAAQRSLEHCGFVLEGRERKAVYLNGQRVDRLCYGLLREEYGGALCG